jgi:hypothetical protein
MPVYVDDDFEGEVPDGASVRAPMMVMDGARGWQPGYAQLTDAQVARKRAARDGYVQKLETAWRTPSRDAAEPDNSCPAAVMRRHLEPDEAAALREKSWRARNDELSRAWQRGRTDPRAATAIKRQGEQWRGGRT